MSETSIIILSVLGINIALFSAFAGLMIWAVNKLDTDIKRIETRIDGHALRIDQLYQMFVDLLSKIKKAE